MTPETMVRFARRSSAPWFAGVALATFAVAHPAAAQSIPSQSTTSTPQDPQHDAAPAEAAAPHAAPVLRNEPWDPEVLKLAESLPIQEEGRIKPLGTFAAFKLLQMNGARTLSFTVDHGTETTSDDEKIRLTSTEWLLDCLFFPDLAVTYPCFQLQTSEVADAIHVAHDKKSKRDRYSYTELYPGLQTLDELANKIAHDPVTKEAKNRTAVEEQVVQLSEKCYEFEKLIGLGEFARAPYPIAEEGSLSQLFGGAREVRFSTLLEKGPLLMSAYKALKDPDIAADSREAKTKALEDLLLAAEQKVRFAAGIAMFPPAVSRDEHKEWLTLADLFKARMISNDPVEPLLPAAGALDDAFASRGNMAAIRDAFTRLHASTMRLATARGEAGKVASEVAFYKADLFFLAQWLYVLGFIAVAIGWMTRGDRKIHRLIPFALMIPLAIHVVGIAWRCYLRARPPVSTLYETILFISAVAVIAALVVEMIDKRRVAVAFAAAIGAAGLFIAASYEAKDAFDSGNDTMPQLQAVLDTNFWLSTHVTTVTIGYSAGLLAGLLAHVYVLGKLFRFQKGDAGFYRAIARMVYGVLCFGLLFSVVGTILGGVWANDSWGRFWGWDPKENGALMICLWELSVLHARMGGYIRDLGVCIAAIFGGTIVAFSWWHVNLLGVGLHSYGFTHGLLGKLWAFYGIEWLIVLGGIWLWLDERAHRKALAAAAPKLAPPRRAPGKGLPDVG